jgi:hypothetical protein
MTIKHNYKHFYLTYLCYQQKKEMQQANQQAKTTKKEKPIKKFIHTTIKHK